MRFDRLGVSFAAIAAAMIAQPSAAWAQEVENEDEAASQPPSGPTIPTIIVTARKRQESLGSIPVTGTILTGEQLETRGIDSSEEFIRTVPGADLQGTGADFNSNIILRGNNARLRGSRQEAGVGFYLNGVFTGRGGGAQAPGQSLGRMDFFDIDRVEVFRGPQGALFGRNSVGGSVNVITARPRADFEGRVHAEYSTNDRVEFEGVLNAPLGDAFALRLGAVFVDQSDGFYTNALNAQAQDVTAGEVGEGTVLDTSEFFGVRGTLRADPSDEFTANLMLQYFDSEQCSTGCFRHSALQGEDPFVRTIDTPSRFTQENFTGQFDFEVDFGDASLVWVSSYTDDQSQARDDLDQLLNQFGGNLVFGVGIGPLTPEQTFILGQNVGWVFAQDNDFERFTQEIRLQSNGDGPLTWLFGAEYLRTDTLEFAAQLTPCSEGALADVPEFCPNNPANPYGFMLPPPAFGFLSNVAASLRAFTDVSRTIDSYAGFGAVTWKVPGTDERLSIDLEARIARDEIRASSDPRNTAFTGTGFVDFDPGTGFDTTIAETIFTPTAAISYDWGDEDIVYARYSEGYRPGGFNLVAQQCGTGGAPNCTLDLIPQTFDWETVWNVEAGLKGRINLRNAGLGIWSYDVAAFYSEREDMQENFVAINAQGQRGAGVFVANVQKAEQFGVEAQLGGVMRLGTDGQAIFNLSLAYADGEYNEVDPAIASIDPFALDIEGNRLRFLSEWQYSAAVTLLHPITSGVEGVLNVSYTGQTGGFQTITNNLATAEDDRNLINVRAGVTFGDFRLIGFVENLTQDEFLLTNDNEQFPGNNVVRNLPRRWGVEMTYSF